MPTSNAYISKTALSTEIGKNGVARSNSCHSLDSKSSGNSEKLNSDSTPPSRLDFRHESHHSFIPYVKERKSFQIRKSSIHKLGDFLNDQNAYYSEFYDSTEELPAVKKCEIFHKRNAYSNGSSKSDIFKTLTNRRFSLNPEVLRRNETSKCFPLNYSSADDTDSYHTFPDSFSNWNDYLGKSASTQQSVDSEENMSISSGHFEDYSDSLSNSSNESDYEQSFRKSIHHYFKNRTDRDSTSSLCTSQSSSYAMKDFPEETMDPFGTLDDVDENHFSNSPTLGNCRLPLHSSLLSLRSTAAEQMLINLGFCDSSEIIPKRFFQDCQKQENHESSTKASKEELKCNFPENSDVYSTERTEDNISKSTEANSNVGHLLMNKKNLIGSCDRTTSFDFEEINRSTVHIINNKHIFYKQKSIHDEIEEANRNTLSATFKNKPEEKSSLTEPNQNDCDQKNQTAQNYCMSSFKNINVEEREKDQLVEEKLVQNSNDGQVETENASYSRIPNIIISNQFSNSVISEQSQESFEIHSIFGEQLSAEFKTETKMENDSNEEACPKSIDNGYLNSCSFLSVSCTSSPAESPLTVIDMSLYDNKNKTSASSEDYIQNRISSSPTDLDSDDTLNNVLLDDQFDEDFSYNSNFHCTQEESSNFIHTPSPSFFIKPSSPSLSDISNSGVEDLYLTNGGNCCWNVMELNPYLTFGPDMVTIYQNSSKDNNEDNNNKNVCPPRFYTSSFNMFIKNPQKSTGLQYDCLEEGKRSCSMTFSPLLINGIRFEGSDQSQDDFSGRFLGDTEDEEDTKQNKVFCFSLVSGTEKTSHCSEKSGKKIDICCKAKKLSIENNKKDWPKHNNKETKNDWLETKVSKANITFKFESKNLWNNKIKSKVIMKNIDQSQNWQRQRLNPMSDKEKHTKDSWTQYDFEDYLRKRNSCNENNINFPMKSLLNKYFLKNSHHPASESKERKMLLNQNEILTSASIKKNGSNNADWTNLKEEVATLDFSTVFNLTSQLPNNSYTEKAVLSLNKSSQTRIWGLYSLCRNELNICAKCLSYVNQSCLQPLGK